jgi:hypothetical protein
MRDAEPLPIDIDLLPYVRSLADDAPRLHRGHFDHP